MESQQQLIKRDEQQPAPVQRDTALEVAQSLERVLIEGDLARLKPDERISYYKAVCESVGLNPLTKPFDFIRLNNRLVLYAKKECTEQLRMKHDVSIRIMDRATVDEVYVVTARAIIKATGREDESTGAVNIKGKKGEDKANCFMKAETKAKRRVTLSICGLAMLDETEVPKDAKEETYASGETYEQIAGRRVAEISGEAETTEPTTVDDDGMPLDGDVPEAVNLLWKRMTDIAGSCKALGELKTQIELLDGSTDKYYETLSRFNMGHANEVKLVGLDKGRKAAYLLVKYIETKPAEKALIALAKTAAGGGMLAYKAFFESLGADEKAYLKETTHEENKLDAEKVDQQGKDEAA